MQHGQRSRPLAIKRGPSTDRSRLEAAAEAMMEIRENDNMFAEAIWGC